MQKIKFTPKSGGSVEITDGNVSAIDGGYRMLRLNEFDGNSSTVQLQSVRCIEMPGQRVISANPAPKTITASIGFAPMFYENGRLACSGEAGADMLRRELLRCFPLGESGTLEYTNTQGTWTITARLDEVPKIAYKAGYYAECVLYLTADYPYWERKTSLPTVVITPDAPATIAAPSHGDIDSPLEGLIECTADTVGSTSGFYFRLRNAANPDEIIGFTKALTAGQKLKFNLGHNNMMTILLKYTNNEMWWTANNYLYYSEYYDICKNHTHETTWIFELLGSAGELSLQLDLHNLYTII